MLRVATWNLWWRFGPWEARQEPIATVLAQADADLIGLQEVWVEQGGANQARVLGERLGLHVAHGDLVFRNGLAFTNAVLTRWPVRRRHVVALPTATGARSHRQIVAVELDSPWGPLVFATTHFDWQFDASLTRQAQAAALSRLVAGLRPDPAVGYPAVVTGDLNATPHSDELRMLTGARPPAVPGLTFVDAWEAAGDGPGHTWNRANPHLVDATFPNRRLDYVLTSWPRPKPLGSCDAVRLLGTEPVGGITASDHFGVVAELRT